MTVRALVNEFAKMRRRRAGSIALLLVLAILALTFYSIVSGPDLDLESPAAWNSILAGLSFSAPMVAPLLLAVLASRQTDIEHDSGGWILHATSGLTPGALCRAKLIALGLITALATAGASGAAALIGRGLVGIVAPFPLTHWLGFTACLVLINLVVLGLHILFAAAVSNQLVGLGIAVLGTLIALFSTGFPAALAHLTPWGYYSLAQPADFRGTEVVALPIAYPSIAALAIVGSVVFVALTARFDRQEA